MQQFLHNELKIQHAFFKYPWYCYKKSRDKLQKQWTKILLVVNFGY